MHDTLLIDTPKKDQIDVSFWKTIMLPMNQEDEEVEFVNPVVAAEWFAEKTADIARLNGQAEALEEEIANLKVHLRRKEHELVRFRRTLFSLHYGQITKSASPEIQAAFVERMAGETGKGEKLAELEGEIEEIKRMIEVREPRRDQLYARLKAIKDAQESARQFLDYSKLEMRLQANGRV